MKKALRIVLKSILWIAVSVIVLLLLIMAVIRVPAVQTWIVHKATTFVSSKTNTKVEIGFVGINFPQSVVIEGLFAEDLSHDTLASIGRLEVDVDMLALLNSSLSVRKLELENATVKLRKTLPDSTFNFQFLIDAFASGKKEPEPADTSSGSFKISADELELKNISFLFEDETSGMKFTTRSALLHLTMDEIDIDSMKFYVDEINIENTHALFAVYKKTAPSAQPVTSDSIPSSLPNINVNRIHLSQSSFLFDNKADTSSFSFSIADLEAKPEKIDLNKEWVEMKELKVERPVALMMMRKSSDTLMVAETRTEAIDTATGWQIKVGEAKLIDGYFKMDFANVPKAKSGMDYSHLHGQNINVDLHDAFYSSKLIKGYLKHASLTEQCGLVLKNLSTRFVYDDTHAELAAFNLETDKTRAGSYIGITYPSISSLADNLGELGIRASFKKTKIHLSDVLLFAPMLIDQPPFNGDADKTITLNGKITGLLKNIFLDDMIVTAGKQTALQMKGRITGLPDIDKSYFHVDVKTFTTSKEDLNDLVGKKYLPQQINIPDQVMINALYKGSIKNFASNLNLESTEGNASLYAELNMDKGAEKFVVDAKVNALNLGYILKNPSVGRLSATVKGQGVSFDQDKMVANVDAVVQSVYFNNYAYNNIVFNAKANKGALKASGGINDKNLVIKLNVDGNISKDSERVDLYVDLTGANFMALGFTKEDLRTGMQLRASVKGFDLQTMDGYAGIGNLLVATPEYRYKFDSITVVTINDPGKHMLELKSPVVNAKYDGSLALNEISPALQEHLNYYLKSDSKMPDTTSGSFTFTADVKPHTVFRDLLLPDLKRFSGIKISSQYSSIDHKLSLDINTPQVVYSTYNFQDLKILATSNQSDLSYSVTLSSLKNGSINLPQTMVNGNIKNGLIDNTTRIVEKDSGDRLLIRNEISMKDGTTRISIKDGRIVLDNKNWTVPENNMITLAPAGMNIQNLQVSNDKNKIDAQSKGTEPGAPVDIKFTDFNLGELAQIIESDTQLVRGSLNGDFNITKSTPFAFTSNLIVKNLTVKEIPVGDISINADNQTANRYTANIELKGNDNNVVIKGYFENETLNLNADIRSITMKSIEAFAPDQINNATGYLTGNVSIKGKASKPDINGKLTFKNTQLTLVAINNRLSMNDETISVNETGIHFSRFTVLDQSNQPLTLNGDVFTTDFMSMKFNLDVKSNRFTALNSSAKNNKVYYGKITINSNIRIRGTNELPVVTADLKLIEGSNFTFIVQKGDLSTDIGEDIVQVINKDTNVFFQFADTLLAGSTFQGIDLTANIEIDRRTTFTIVVDKTSGDRLVVAGDAILNFGLDQSGKMSLTGTYTLNSGSYKASLQNIVKREFFIKSGSRITWTGDPTSAKIDITAIYKVRTGASDLMAVENVSVEERNKYRKLLDYEVNLIIKGDLTDPELSFYINLSEDDRNAFGGEIESRLMAINNDPNEQNKQVLALLVANKFLPPSNASALGGAGGGTSAIARNSVNQLLADQLTAFGSKLIKGGELNVDIQSNDDYGSTGAVSQQNTQVGVDYKQNLFNERLSVQVGGNVNVNDNSPQATGQQNITGDVVVEYKITEDGRYRFKAFRENNYEGLIDGMLYKTGVGIMYSREYDSLKELLSKPKTEEEEELVPKNEKKKKKDKKKK